MFSADFIQLEDTMVSENVQYMVVQDLASGDVFQSYGGFVFLIYDVQSIMYQDTKEYTLFLLSSDAERATLHMAHDNCFAFKKFMRRAPCSRRTST